ncbi:protein of unknown function [Desulfurobacterium atlanticum]|uniref:DUF4282 domain-containing protein n=1 Tax=Desulfurobacterium atlanticum TaxID=240169 RepID=A0A238Z6W9_9BACT|nr:protein of unknown function [Desulfurobacterium atlanticum]
MGEKKEGFIDALFDFSFSKFITPKIAGVWLIVAYLFESLIALGALLSSLNAGGTAFVSTLILVALILPVALIGTRITIEGMVSLVKIAEESVRIRELLENKARGESEEEEERG